MPPLTPPEQCHSMRDLRTEIDRFDRQLVEMLVRRAAYIDRAAELKPAEGLPARIPDRVEAVVNVIGRMGTRLTATDDGFVVHGRSELHGARVDGGGDHRIGMLGAIAGSLADGETRIENDAVGVSYPRFWDDLALAASGGKITA